jgi:hypothetical protein
VIDTLTVEGVTTANPVAVWQRFRTGGDRAQSIVLQGPCERS